MWQSHLYLGLGAQIFNLQTESKI